MKLKSEVLSMTGKFSKRAPLKAQQFLGIMCKEWVILAAARLKFSRDVAICSANMSKQSEYGWVSVHQGMYRITSQAGKSDKAMHFSSLLLAHVHRQNAAFKNQNQSQGKLASL